MTKKEPVQTVKKSPPLKVFVIEDVSASVFDRQHSVNGELVTFYSVSFSRSYRDSHGNRKYIKSFNLEDLGKLVTVAQQAEAFIRARIEQRDAA